MGSEIPQVKRGHRLMKTFEKYYFCSSVLDTSIVILANIYEVLTMG